MRSKIIPKLAVDLAQSASSEQTGGMVNGAKGVCM
jgi:hypothetical protein